MTFSSAPSGPLPWKELGVWVWGGAYSVATTSFQHRIGSRAEGRPPGAPVANSGALRRRAGVRCATAPLPLPLHGFINTPRSKEGQLKSGADIHFPAAGLLSLNFNRP